MAMVVVLSVMNGFGSSIRERLFLVEPHLVVKFDRTKTLSEIQEDRDHLLAEIHRDHGVRASYFEQQDVIIRTSQGLFGGGQVRGLKTAALREVLMGLDRILEIQSNSANQAKSSQVAVPQVPALDSTASSVASTNSKTENGIGSGAANESPKDRDVESSKNADVSLARGEVMMGVDLARTLGIYEGDEVMLVSPEALLLPVGEVPPYEKVIVKKMIRSSVPDIDGKLIYFRLEDGLKRLADGATLTRGVEIRISNPYEFGPIQGRLKKQGWQSESWQERNTALFYSLKVEKMLMSVFLGLTVFIASFSIVIVLVLLGIQKRKDIGALMAMGLSSERSMWLFTRIGMLLSGCGMLGGLSVGLVVCVLGQNFQIIKLPDIYYDTRIPFQIDPLMVLAIAVVGTLISFVAAYVPARISARMLPSQALRG